MGIIGNVAGIIIAVVGVYIAYVQLKRTPKQPKEQQREMSTRKTDRLDQLAKASDAVELVDVVRINPEFKETFLAQTGYQCSICHTSLDVNFYSIGQIQGSKAGYKNLIALCPNCHRQAMEERIPQTQLRSIKKVCIETYQAGIPFNILREKADELYKEAFRLSLSKNIWNVKRARIKCQEILHYCDPFHTDAQVLIEKLLRIEKEMELELSKADYKLSAPIEIKLAWLFLMLLPAVLIEEIIHAFSYWIFGLVRNANGKRMPLLKTLKYIEINDLTLIAGIKDAIRRGGLYSANVNLSKMQRDWYAEIEF